jgi:hypothetical protein
MLLFQLLEAVGIAHAPAACKVHLAVFNGVEEPLDVYLAGNFDPWQECQRRRNFERPHVVGLISLPEKDRWLFAGFYDSEGCGPKDARGLHRYRLTRREEADELAGRLVIDFRRTGRQSYLNAEHLAPELHIAELRPKPLTVVAFPGYSSIVLSKVHLDIIVAHDEPAWRGALTSVAGVYVIVDRASGQLYVGSATGSGGIWARWVDYSHSGHGGNKELIELLQREGAAHATNFQFGILEIADVQTHADIMLERESFWKELLLSRRFGLNAN